MSSSKTIIIHSDNKKDTDFEIPIEISKEPQSKLNNLTQKLNLNLDSLVSREEQLFEIENNASKKKLEEKSSFQAHADSVQNSIRFFNEKSAPTKKSPTLPPRKPTRQKPATDSPPQPEGFDLIKVSIVNKRPVSPDIEDILNGVDEEHYLDKSFVFQDELIKQIEEETKRLSSLDPSIAQEYDCGSSVRSGSVYSKEKYPFATTYSSSSIRAAVTPATGGVAVGLAVTAVTGTVDKTDLVLTIGKVGLAALATGVSTNNAVSELHSAVKPADVTDCPATVPNVVLTLEEIVPRSAPLAIIKPDEILVNKQLA
jgi:hypothetical protein